MTTPAESPRYFAFISYSHRDEQSAQWLHKALETYRVPSRLVGQTIAGGTIPRRLLPIFRDRDELASSSDLGRTVNAALAQSRNLIVICSPDSAQSRWVNEEVLAFKRLHGGERIFCLIVDGEPDASYMPGREAEECFAPALRYTLGVDGQPTAQRTEPVAADAREGKDGKANAKLKLIAGMLDVGFDALKQRELQRRNRRMAIITVAALVIMAITTTLAITAVIARKDAERRQKQAEDLVGFMLGDLNDKLREVNRLDILQAVDDKAMAYFASLPTKDVTDEALAQRAKALEKIGNVRINQGQIPSALEAFRSALALADELLKRAPANTARQADYANIVTWIGNAYWHQGELGQAADNFKKASEMLRAAAAASPQDSELAVKLCSALTNTGRVLEARGEFAAAQPYYEAVLKTFSEVSAREPANVRWQSELGQAYDSLGKLALEQGQLAAAITAYRTDQRLQEQLAARDPANHNQQYELVISNAILGRTLALGGELDAAARYLADAVAQLRTLLAFDPTQAEWQYLLARYSEQLGGVLRQQRRFDEAARVDADSLRTLQSLVAKDATNSDWQQELAASQLENARLQLDQGNLGGAEKFVGPARAAVEQLRTKAPDDRNLILLAAQGDIVAATLAARHDDAATAQAVLVHGRDLISPAAQSGSDLKILVAWASTLLLLDDLDAARPVVERLAEMGYRTPDFVALVESKKFAYPVNAEFSRRIADSLK